MSVGRSINEPGPIAIDSSCRSAPEILTRVAESAREELNRSSRALGFSGLAGGLTMGLTGLSVAVVRSMLGPGTYSEFIANLFYPIGFIAVIIGRAQLFTEDTLYPVILVLDERKQFWNTLRLWTVVFVANVFGALLFALLVGRTPALMPNYSSELVKLGLAALSQNARFVLWSGVIGGWLIALVAWMVTASHWTVGQLMVIWLLTFVVGLGNFAHCIATSSEILSAVVTGLARITGYLHWLAFATMGNIVGGVTIVSMLNYGQVRAGQLE